MAAVCTVAHTAACAGAAHSEEAAAPATAQPEQDQEPAAMEGRTRRSRCTGGRQQQPGADSAGAVSREQVFDCGYRACSTSGAAGAGYGWRQQGSGCQPAEQQRCRYRRPRSMLRHARPTLLAWRSCAQRQRGQPSQKRCGALLPLRLCLAARLCLQLAARYGNPSATPSHPPSI